MSKSMEDVLKAAQDAANEVDHEDHDEAVRVALEVAVAMLKEAGFGSQHDAFEHGRNWGIEQEYAYGAENKVAFDNPYPATEGAS